MKWRARGITIFLTALLVLRCGSDFGIEPDTNPPGIPVLIYAAPGNQVVLLTWNPVPAHDLKLYRVYGSEGDDLNFGVMTTVSGSDSSVMIGNLANGVIHYFKMTAVDDSDNESDFSNVLTATPLEAGLPAPVILTAVPGYETITIGWGAVLALDLDHFNMYLSDDNETYSLAAEVPGNLLSTTISALNNGTIYFVKMTTADSDGNESDFSNIVSARPPGGNFYLATGWELFESGSYTQAIANFDTCLLYYDNLDDEARTGLGWSCAYRASGGGSDHPDYLMARNYLQLADNIDANAGLTLVLNALNDYENSVYYGKLVVAENANYQFSHDYFVTAFMIRLTVAQSAFELGDYGEVVLQLEIIDPGVSHSADDPEGLLERLQLLWANLYD